MSQISLDDKYAAETGRVFVTGSQALVRLPLDQARRDRAQGLKTAGFISGYRGSPLGVYDFALWRAERFLREANIHFEPGVNEDLAATAVWGTQQATLLKGARYQGVFALWYGKGPGVDRSADAIKHGAYAGTSPHGGVLLLCGDDHAARSSTLAHQSDHALIHCGVPVLNPADIQELLDLGLFGFALSRYSGCWIGFKCITDVVDGSASIWVDPIRLDLRAPTDYFPPPDGLSIRQELAALKQEARLFEHRLLAAQAFARANRLDHQAFGASGRKRLGIVASGKTWRDMMEAFARLGVDAERAQRLGIGAYKVSMVWPLEPEGLKAFAKECEELLVVEEKRGVIEEQIAHVLYNLPADSRPRLVGKRDPEGRPFISEVGELNPERVLRAIAARLLALDDSEDMRRSLARGLELEGAEDATPPAAARIASFCAGCPHNTSTVLPEGSIAIAGIGCHGMASLMPERRTLAGTHMGGEGAPWIGIAPFVDTPHIFQNLGDGTYFHSGLLAIRACVTANVNITYKILLNGAVGMTGGQPIEGEQFRGEITAPRVAHQVASEGVRRIAVVSEDLSRYEQARDQFPAIVSFHHRDELDAVQRELREYKGVSVLIYDQSCATERRRLRKRGKLPEPDERLFIHPQVCEGCGDCGRQSNCIAIEPLDTEFGRKRRINQSVCNKDYSCLKGFCPSFVTVVGGKVRANQAAASPQEATTAVPEPTLPAIGDGYSVLVTGIGGNGVVTIGAILGMAGHIESKTCTVLDMSGFAQRNGSVMSHVRFAPDRDRQRAARIPAGAADVVLGCDPIVTASPDCVSMMAPGRGVVVMNQFVAPTSAFALNPDLRIDVSLLQRRIQRRVGETNVIGVDATRIATTLLGDAIGANMFIVGYAWQRGLIPLQRDSIETAIRLNGTAVEMNLRAFELGRFAAADPDRFIPLADPPGARTSEPDDLAALVEHRKAHLEAYQDRALAQRYAERVERVASAERALGGERRELAMTVARVYAKLLSYKDEYEVARLFTQPEFRRQLEEQFSGDLRLKFNLAPPLLAKRDPRTGRLRKMEFGPWILRVFKLLAGLRKVRGTPLDVFGYSEHRRLERRLIGEYEQLVDAILASLRVDNHAAAVKLAACYDVVRGYDVVKESNIAEMRRRVAAAQAEFERDPGETAPSTTPDATPEAGRVGGR